MRSYGILLVAGQVGVPLPVMTIALPSLPFSLCLLTGGDLYDLALPVYSSRTSVLGTRRIGPFPALASLQLRLFRLSLSPDSNSNTAFYLTMFHAQQKEGLGKRRSTVKSWLGIGNKASSSFCFGISCLSWFG